MKIAAIIPARYGSTRFPGKALADLGGKTMIQRVVEQARKSKLLADVVVATDDDRIFGHVQELGATVLMTSEAHQNGTERCAEALTLLHDDYEFVINIQGDEPFIKPEQINLLVSILDKNTKIATLAKKIGEDAELFSPHVNKVVINNQNQGIYFSRSPIPYFKGLERTEWIKKHIYYKHIGIYAYQAKILKKITHLDPSPLEAAEGLEQLRWIENGIPVRVSVTPYDSIGIDTPEDLERVAPLLIES